MSIRYIDIAANIIYFSNIDNDVGTDRYTPVVYRIYRSSSRIFTISLNVPMRSTNDRKDSSKKIRDRFYFFSKLENDCLMNFQSSSVRNIEKHVFRLSLSYLQSLSTTISGEERFLLSELETHQQISAPWLDRSRFKK